MIQKPSDLLFSILEFFGVLIPGAIFTFLHGNLLLHPLGFALRNLQAADEWVPAFFVSILVGHLLHGLSDPFDRIATRRLSDKATAYLDEARKTLKLPDGIPEHPKSWFIPDDIKNHFYAAFSFIRIHNPIAVTELERHAADFKLFRSLTLLFFLETLFSLYPFSLTRLVIAALITCFAAFRYMQLFDWCYALAFDLYEQIRNAEEGEAARKASSKISQSQVG